MSSFCHAQGCRCSAQQRLSHPLQTLDRSLLTVSRIVLISCFAERGCPGLQIILDGTVMHFRGIPCKVPGPYSQVQPCMSSPVLCSTLMCSVGAPREAQGWQNMAYCRLPSGSQHLRRVLPVPHGRQQGGPRVSSVHLLCITVSGMHGAESPKHRCYLSIHESQRLVQHPNLAVQPQPASSGSLHVPFGFAEGLSSICRCPGMWWRWITRTPT